MATKEQPIIIILGPTASGKTGLSLELAKDMSNMEIICADSRTIYRGMDIGTAKPSSAETSLVSHHLLDILNPDERYSAAEFQSQVNKIIKDIRSRGKVPVLVGGSGLYLFSIMYDYSFPAGPANSARAELQTKGIDELRSILQYLDIDAFSKIDINNPRRLIRAIETAGLDKPQNTKLIDNACVLGLNTDLKQLEARISIRTRQMIKDGLVDEVKSLVEEYGPSCEPFQTVGYREIIDYIDGKCDLDQAEKLINLHTRQLAKRQITWFKRSKDINWVDSYSDAVKEINKFTRI